MKRNPEYVPDAGKLASARRLAALLAEVRALYPATHWRPPRRPVEQESEARNAERP